MATEAKLYTLAKMAQDEPMAGIARRRIMGAEAMVSEVLVEKGCEVPWHEHPNEQFVILLNGRLQFDVAAPDGGRTRHVLEPGDILHLPGHVAHGGTALEDCRVFDIFSPPTENAGIDRPKGS
ncbi:MAG: cupin domain-containing protein [Geminicoccaceae bacterium]